MEKTFEKLSYLLNAHEKISVLPATPTATSAYHAIMTLAIEKALVGRFFELLIKANEEPDKIHLAVFQGSLEKFKEEIILTVQWKFPDNRNQSPECFNGFIERCMKLLIHLK